ncbi:hypothetical protein QYF36_019851 [Acer negundo]|nr:hypothetical protein QYF36_019851 [Acer negundo]
MAFGRRAEPSSSNSLAETPSHFFKTGSCRRTDPSSSTSLTETAPHFFKVILPATIEEKKMNFRGFTNFCHSRMLVNVAKTPFLSLLLFRFLQKDL